MPAPVVKNKREEGMWDRAKELAHQTGADKKWGLVMRIFQNIKKSKEKKS